MLLDIYPHLNRLIRHEWLLILLGVHRGHRDDTYRIEPNEELGKKLLHNWSEHLEGGDDQTAYTEDGPKTEISKFFEACFEGVPGMDDNKSCLHGYCAALLKINPSLNSRIRHEWVLSLTLADSEHRQIVPDWVSYMKEQAKIYSHENVDEFARFFIDVVSKGMLELAESLLAANDNLHVLLDADIILWLLELKQRPMFHVDFDKVSADKIYRGWLRHLAERESASHDDLLELSEYMTFLLHEGFTEKAL